MMETTKEERDTWKATAEWGLSSERRPKPSPIPDCDVEEAILRLIRDVDTLVKALEPILAYYDDGVGSADTMREEHLPRARAALALR